MIPGRRGLLVLAGILGSTGVVLSAMGAHLVDSTQAWSEWRSWQSANSLHWFHALAILGLAVLAGQKESIWPGLLGLLMTLGIVLFSGTIYASMLFSLGGAPLAPLGGSILILSWALLALLAGLKKL